MKVAAPTTIAAAKTARTNFVELDVLPCSGLDNGGACGAAGVGGRSAEVVVAWGGAACGGAGAVRASAGDTVLAATLPNAAGVVGTFSARIELGSAAFGETSLVSERGGCATLGRGT